MNDWLDILRHGAGALGLAVTTEEERLFSSYLELLHARNAQVNLTAITEPAEVAAKHFVDSLTVETVWRPTTGDRVIDIGAGAGFPGIPLAIRHPDVAFTLNDATRKKVGFMQEVADILPLPNVHPLWARAETLGHLPAHRGTYQAAFARALAHLAVILEYALPLLAPDGRLIAMKGPSGDAEIAESARALQTLGGEVIARRQLTVSGAGDRLLIVVRATHPAPGKYPRNAAEITKRPLLLDSRPHGA